MKHDLEANKKNAIAFYRMAYSGDPKQAVETYVGGEYMACDLALKISAVRRRLTA